MAKQLITWQEKVSATAYDTIYPETLSEQVHINNEIANNLGISPEVSLDTALGKLSATDKNIRAQGVATGTATALALSVNVFTLFDGVVVRAKIPFDTEKKLNSSIVVYIGYLEEYFGNSKRQIIMNNKLDKLIVEQLKLDNKSTSEKLQVIEDELENVQKLCERLEFLQEQYQEEYDEENFNNSSLIIQ